MSSSDKKYNYLSPAQKAEAGEYVKAEGKSHFCRAPETIAQKVH